MAVKKGSPGRPPRYTSPEQIEGLIEEYFKRCEGKVLTIKTEDGQEVPMLDKYGQPIIYDVHPPTVSGLALALGFESRQTLLNYQGKKEFRRVITRAKSRIEMYTEERLFDRDGANGAKFSLENNWGWNKPKEAAGEAAPVVNIICDVPREAPEPERGESDA